MKKQIITPPHVDFDEDFVNKDLDNQLIYKTSQLTKRISYLDAEKKNIKPLHLGQFKLFFSELIFITKKSIGIRKVLYVGAAVGYHVGKLADLFPDIMFDLWDPEKFDIDSKPNIKIYNNFFTNEKAQLYREDGENPDRMLFMCDMRNLEVEEAKKDPRKMDQITNKDMEYQSIWAKIIKPKYSYLKFRVPYIKQKFSYLNGTIYLQPYTPMSTECRLMTNNYDQLKIYDNVEFDELMAYFNSVIRFDDAKYDRWSDEFEKYNLLNCWDNTMGFYICDYYLRMIKNITSDEETGKMFMDILNFHSDRYGNKYDVVFNN